MATANFTTQSPIFQNIQFEFDAAKWVSILAQINASETLKSQLARYEADPTTLPIIVDAVAGAGSMKTHLSPNRTTVGNLFRRASIAGLVIAMTSACVAQVPKSEPDEVLAVRRLGEAIRAVNWSATTESAARESIERAIESFGWGFRHFGLADATKNMPRRMAAELTSKVCPSPTTWIAGLGLPTELKYLTIHVATRVETAERIARALSGEEVIAGPLGTLAYPIPGQPAHSLRIAESDKCFNTLNIHVNLN